MSNICDTFIMHDHDDYECVGNIMMTMIVVVGDDKNMIADDDDDDVA